MNDTPEPLVVPVRRRRHRVRRLILIVILLIIVVPIAAAVAAFLTFDPNAYKDRIAAVVKQATGRDVTFAGPLAVKLSWIPTVTARDVRLANIPGASAPDMARIDEIETRVALLPFLQHRIEIQNLVLRGPSILLERTADGRPNWLFQRQDSTQSGAAPSSNLQVGTDQTGAPWRVTIDALEITNGHLTWKDDRSGKTAALDLAHATLAAQSAGTAAPDTLPMTVAADATWQGTAVTLSGTTGPFAHLTNPDDRSAWPLHLTLAAAGASVLAEGSITDPLHGHGYAIALHGSAPVLEALNPLLPAGTAPLPPIHGLMVAANVADTGQPLPRITNLTVQAQASDLDSLAHGLKLDSLSMITPALDQPVTIDILGERGGLAFTLSGSIGPLGGLLAPAIPAPGYPVDLMLSAAQSNLHLTGTIAAPRTLRGADLTVATQIADLSVLSPLAGTPLPRFTTLAGTAKLNDAAQGFGQGFSLTALNLTAPEGDLEGQFGMTYGARTKVVAALRSTRLDVDALRGISAPTAAPATVAAAPATPAPLPVKTQARLIPDLPLPVAGLRAMDGTIGVAFASLRYGGAEYRALVAQATLADGVLSLAPSSVVIPGGAVALAGTLDAHGPVPRLALSGQAQAIAIAPLLAALGGPQAASGLASGFANLTATGGTTRAMAATLSGPIGISTVNGVVDGRALAGLAGPALRAARVLPPELLTAAGNVAVRCFALRLDAINGLATVGALVLDTSNLLMQGTGVVNFGTEGLALALKPELRLGQTDVSVPVTVNGTFAAPHLASSGSVTIDDQSHTNGLNGFLQSLLGNKRKATPASNACGPALALARNGQPGPAPEDGGPGGVLQKPINLLQQLINGQ
ncbi:AsmA family protein [Acidisoma cladoniae]|uniref:AsmA family protein n=1 Tax=Acidisoma cladoniae TaxID=3040935 RepID=UPI00254E8B1D|nr:AsmA family protein [Acidisoma sp. PAMC 29798]